MNTLFRKAEGAIAAVDPAILDQLTGAERKGWDWIVTGEVVTTAKYQEEIGLPERTARNQIKRLRDLDLLEKEGSGPSTWYRGVRS